MVGAARRLATELVVIMASAIQEIHCSGGCLGASYRLWAAGWPGTSMALMPTSAASSLLERVACPGTPSERSVRFFERIFISSPPRHDVSMDVSSG